MKVLIVNGSPRIKVTVCSTMYNMSDNIQTGYDHINDNEESRYQARLAVAKQRTVDYKNGNHPFGGGCPALGLLYSGEAHDYYHEDVTKCEFFKNGWYEKVNKALEKYVLINPLDI